MIDRGILWRGRLGLGSRGVPVYADGVFATIGGDNVLATLPGSIRSLVRIKFNLNIVPGELEKRV